MLLNQGSIPPIKVECLLTGISRKEEALAYIHIDSALLFHITKVVKHISKTYDGEIQANVRLRFNEKPTTLIRPTSTVTQSYNINPLMNPGMIIT